MGITLIKDQEHLDSIVLPDVVGFDIETWANPDELTPKKHGALDPLVGHIRTLQFGWGEDAYIIDFFKFTPNLENFWKDKLWVGQNIKFEGGFFLTHNLPLPVHVWDTMLAHQVLSAGLPSMKQASLHDIALNLLGVELDKTFQTVDWKQPFSPEMLEYAAMDALVVLPIYEIQKEAAKQAGLLPTIELENRAVFGFAWIEVNGFPIDYKALLDIGVFQIAERNRAEDRINALSEGMVKNWQSNPQIKAWLQTIDPDIEETNETYLKDLIRTAGPELREAIEALWDFREKQTLINKYSAESLGKKIHPSTKRFHPEFIQIVSTGRTACKEPNLQNIPRSKQYRSMFKPLPGRVFGIGDYSQVELRIMAQVAKDDKLLDYFNSGVDPHIETAIMVVGQEGWDSLNEEERKKIRQKGKDTNFSAIYGISAESLGVRLGIPTDAASVWLQRFFKLYRGVRTYLNGLYSNGKTTSRTVGGRRVLNVKRFNDKANFPIQGTAADAMKMAIVKAWETRGLHPSIDLVNEVHDELIMECNIEDKEEMQEWLSWCLLEGLKEYLRACPPTAEVHVASDWSEK